MNLEQQPNVPRELDKEKPFKILLHFVRHGKKDGPNDVDWETDVAMPLTQLGREQAQSLSSRAETEHSLAVGGQRRRLRETALRAVAGGDRREIDFPELLDTLDTHGERLGRRLWQIKGLDFALEKTGAQFEEINATPEYVRKIVELHKAHPEDSLYSRQAYNLARIIDWAAQAAPKLQRRYEHHLEQGTHEEKDGPTREVFLATQGSVSESFLAEVIHRTRGDQEWQRFVDTVPKGVAETQGFDVELITKGEEPTLRLRFHLGSSETVYSYDDTIPLTVIRDIVRDFGPREA